jgi:hypothetical protein
MHHVASLTDTHGGISGPVELENSEDLSSIYNAASRFFEVCVFMRIPWWASKTWRRTRKSNNSAVADRAVLKASDDDANDARCIVSRKF